MRESEARQRLLEALERTPLPTGLPAMAGGPGPLSQVRRPGKLDELELVKRATQGVTLAQVSRAREIGWDAWLEEQLDPESLDDSLVDQILSGLPTLPLSSWQLYNKYYVEPEQQSVPAVELIAAMVVRSIYSRRQLFERMVELWSDHFNVDITDNFALIFRTTEDREVIRRHAFDTFPKLLRASSRSAAMSWYLDNYANVTGAPNENYARELMELHTLGVDGPYTEQDVVEVARCFTGWRFWTQNDPQLGSFLFYPPAHDDGFKTVLGHPIPAGGGVADGDAVLDILAHHPKTAEFIATKMCRWFLSYEPPQSVVDAVTATYLATGGDIKSMLRVILSEDSVTRANPILNPKFKRPLQLVTALVRATAPQINDLTGLLIELQTMGQLPFTWPAPNGFPDSFGAWSGALRPRWAFAQKLFDNQVPGTFVDVQELLYGDGGVPQSMVAERVDKVLTGGTLAPDDRALVQQFVDSFPSVNAQVARDAFSLAASSPSFQNV